MVQKEGNMSQYMGICYVRNEEVNLRGGTRKVGKQERNRRKNEGERAGKKT